MQIGKVKIKNRISMAPMGLVGYADSEGGFNTEAQNYYIERAKGGTGLIITGICSVDYNELPENGLPCPTYNPLMFVKSTAPMIEKIHAYDAKIFLQLTGGTGRSSMPSLVKNYIAPSENQNRFNPDITHHEMSIDDIQQLIKNFVKSALIAKQSGFDGVEIHAVHEGYLLDQFALSIFNKREDEYGGDLQGRLKIATDIVKDIKEACGAEFPVSLRYSLKSFMKDLRKGALPGEKFSEVGRDYEEGLEAARILATAGYDALNVDVGTYDSWYWNHPPMYFDPGMYRPFGKLVKDVVDIPVILAGRMDNPDIALNALEASCDMVAYGRPLLADPYLPEKIRMNQLDDIRPCLSCHDGCMGRIAQGLPLSCTVNPACGREAIYGLEATADPKHILIIGGGLAGMEAARVSATRGHQVTLVEASNQLGGNIIPGGVPEFKKDDRALVKWYELQLKKLKIALEMNTRLEASDIENYNADIVIVATGSKPRVLDLGDKNNVYIAEDVLLKKVEVTDDIVLIGGGLVGCETALWLAQSGKNVTIVEAAGDILGGPHGVPFMNGDMLRDLLAYENVEVLKSTQLTEVNKASVLVETPEGEREIKATTIITAIGYIAENKLFESIKLSSKPVYNIGDSRQVKNILHAIWDAYEIARAL